MSNRNFNRKQSLEREIKDIYLEAQFNPLIQASGVLDLTADVTLTKLSGGSVNNARTFTTQVVAPAANPTNTVLFTFSGTAAAITCTVTPNDGTNNPANTPAVAAVATLDLTSDIVLTSVATGAARNTTTLTTQVLVAAANPTNTVLVSFTGTAAAIVCTVTPNDGTNNTATPVDLTTAELVELINTGAVVGKVITLTDASSRRVLQTATGGGAEVLVDSGEGDGVVATFASGANLITVPVTVTTANLVQLINTGLITGKVPTITDASALRALQTASGGGVTPMADAGEGDGVVATFSGAQDYSFSNITKWGVSSIAQTGTGAFRITMEDKYNTVKFVDAMVKSATAQNIVFQIKADDINGAIPYIDVISHANGVAANPSDGAVLKFVIEVKNTDII